MNASACVDAKNKMLVKSVAAEPAVTESPLTYDPMRRKELHGPAMLLTILPRQARANP